MTVAGRTVWMVPVMWLMVAPRPRNERPRAMDRRGPAWSAPSVRLRATDRGAKRHRAAADDLCANVAPLQRTRARHTPGPRSTSQAPAPEGRRSCLHHAAHVGHAAADAGPVLVRDLGDDGLRREDVLRDRGGVLQRRARDHRRVDDALGDEVDDLAGRRVQAQALLGLADVVDDDRALEAGVLRDLAERLLERAKDDAGAGALVIVVGIGVDGAGRAQERDAAAGNDAFLERRAGRLEGVLDAVLLLLHLRLGGRADLHDGDAAGELGEALLELLAIEVRVGVLDLALDLVDAALDGVLLTGAVDDRRRVLRDDDATGAAELRELGVLELEAHLLGDDLAAGEDHRGDGPQA